MASEIMLCFLNDNPNEIVMAELYWSIETDKTWRHTVKEIADYYSISASSVPSKVGAAAEMHVRSKRCTLCGNPRVARSRSDFAEIIGTSQGICQFCHLQRIKEEKDRKNAIWLRETSFDGTFDYQEACYLDAFYSFVLLVNSDFDGESGEIVLPEAKMFAPEADLLRRVIVDLHKKGVLLFGKKTPLDAFVIENDQQSFSYYPHKISWRFALPIEDQSFDYLLSDLGDIIDSREEYNDYPNAIERLWWNIALSEAQRYLDLQLDSYRLSIDESEKLREAFKYLLRHFSIPQVRNLIWRVAKDVAAYSARRDIHRRQAINSIPGNLIRICDRALANQWTISSYVLKWDEEESLITTTLFDRVFRTGVDGFKSMTGELLSDLIERYRKYPLCP